MLQAIIAILFSVILLNLLWTLIPTAVVFLALALFGIHMGFWTLYLIVFVVIFTIRLF